VVLGGGLWELLVLVGGGDPPLVDEPEPEAEPEPPLPEPLAPAADATSFPTGNPPVS
jgi:hypothetical protein